MRRLLASLVVLTALGCQAPLPLTPHVSVQQGTLDLAPYANLGVAVDFRALLGYHVAASEPTESHGINKIVANVVGGPIAGVEGVWTSVNTVDCPDGVATFQFSNMPAGTMTVKVSAFDDQGNVVASGESPVTIVEGQGALVKVSCSQNGGGVKIVVPCIQVCGVVPSATPSPTASTLPPITVPAEPLDLVVDRDGNVCAILSGHGLEVRDPHGQVLYDAQPGNTFYHLAIDPDQLLWVSGVGAVLNLTRMAETGYIFFQDTARTYNTDIHLDAQGHGWATSGLSSVVELSADATTLLGTFPVGSHPTGIWFDPAGNGWVPNSGDGTVTKLSATGATLGTFTTLANPQRIAFAADGDTLVASDTAIAKLSPTGVPMATLHPAAGIADLKVDQAGHLWVADAANNHVLELSPAGSVLRTYAVPVDPVAMALAPGNTSPLWVASRSGRALTRIDF